MKTTATANAAAGTALTSSASGVAAPSRTNQTVGMGRPSANVEQFHCAWSGFTPQEPDRWFEEPIAPAGSEPVYLLSTDLDSSKKAEKKGPLYGFDIELRFPKEGMPRQGRGLIVCLDELLLDARGRRNFLASLMDTTLPLPTVIVSFDFLLQPPTVVRPGLMVAMRLDDLVFRCLRDGYVYPPAVVAE